MSHDRRVILWGVVLSLLTFLLPGLAQSQALSIPQREALERAFTFLGDNGHSSEVAELRQLAARGHIRGGELASTDNAETVGREVTVRSNLLLPTGNPGTLAEFKSTSNLAQLLLHELVHVKQTRPGSDPASASSEGEAWGTWMQATYDWLTARERRLAGASGDGRKRLAQ